MVFECRIEKNAIVKVIRHVSYLGSRLCCGSLLLGFLPSSELGQHHFPALSFARISSPVGSISALTVSNDQRFLLAAALIFCPIVWEKFKTSLVDFVYLFCTLASRETACAVV